MCFPYIKDHCPLLPDTQCFKECFKQKVVLPKNCNSLHLKLKGILEVILSDPSGGENGEEFVRDTVKNRTLPDRVQGLTQ